MFQYLMSPITEHYDSGLGAMGEAFYRSAEILKAHPDKPIFLEQLPQAFLLRHAIELYIKSSIVIIHRKLRIPYGDQPYDATPMILIKDKWVPAQRVHSVGQLYEYWHFLFVKVAEPLQAKCEMKIDFDVPEGLTKAIEIIETSDPNSTRYRYPVNRNRTEDVEKSPFKEVGPDQLFPESEVSRKQTIALIIENKDREFVTAYKFDDETEKVALEALTSAAYTFNCIHAMMRIAVTNGW